MKKNQTTLFAMAGVLALAGCTKQKAETSPAKGAEQGTATQPAKTEEAEKTGAMVEEGAEDASRMGPYEIQPKSGSTVTGQVTLREVDEGVEVAVMVQNAPPGLHGTHIHEESDCSAADAKSAGGHFAPRGNQHGLPSDEEHHLGDLGNLEVGDNGSGQHVAVAEGATLDEGGAMSFVGRALIFHEKKDDGGQPTGNAGSRLACAELTASKMAK